MTPRKKLLFIAGCIVGIVILAMAFFLLLIDVNAYKPLIETAVSDALGMGFKINGRMNIVLFPRFGFSARDVSIRKQQLDIFSASGMRTGLKLLPLMKREIRINEFEIVRPKFFIERDKGGRFNFAVSGEKALPVSLLTMEKFVISQGEILFSDRLSDARTEVKDFDLVIRDLSFGASKGPLLRNISFSGEFSCRTVKTKELEIGNPSFEMRGKDGIFDVNPFTMNFFGGTEKGSIRVDTTGEIPLLRIQYTASGFRFEKFVETLSRKKIMKGKMDFSLNIATEGKSADEMKRRVNGDVSLMGENLLLYSLDIDNLLSKIEESRSFSLVDLGAYFLAGPLGTALTKGYDFASAYGAMGAGEGKIEKLVSRWRIRNGVAEAEDVALTSKKNRVALKGRLDFVKERFDNVTVAALDERGCSKLSQKIEGPFRNPRVDKISTVETIAGPVLKLVQKAKKFIEGEKCRPFYEGSVKHPV